ncbi:putative disease resistance protein RGA3 [Miscanthus floridulus]|uniref:putative disease resistance protein RGA3 n=1 Tax=Miscanthus floridulus TaxID=154761 RepID=UPI00345A16A4
MAGVGEALVSVVLKEVLRNLGSAVGEQIKARWKLEQDMEYIKCTLVVVQAVLKDAERRSVREEPVRLWLKMLKNAAYDISDMLDEFEIKLSQGTISSFVAKFSMGKKLKNMREKLANIAAQRTQFGFMLDACSTDEEEIKKRQTTSKINRATIVGRHKEKEEIVTLLNLDDEKETLVIPIFGFGGIGKTILAKLVFNDDRMQSFDLRAWVFVSPHFDLRMIGKSIISQIKGKVDCLDDLQAVSNCLEETLDGKSCLIVLDDLWESNCFRLGELMLMLSSFKKESMVRVIVTTRNEEVARNIGTVAPYKLKPLSDDYCWALFRQIAFQSGCTLGEGDTDALESIGQTIAKKCKGVPLAAQALGFMLRTKDVWEWENMRDSEIWEGPSTDDVLPSLKLSYYHMPPYLKLCFSYCSVFPKGCEIHRDNLIQQWISLGFIHSSSRKDLTLEKIGENYVNELLGMSFLQYSRITSLITEDTKNCMLLSMHDLIHDLARSVMDDELLLMDGKKDYDSEYGNYRYALVVNCPRQTASCSDVPAKLRALHVFDCGEIPMSLYSKSLRVLDLSKCSNGNLPAYIGKLKQLRYLSAVGMQHEQIPEHVTGLSNLIYLNLSGSPKISKLPDSVNKLRSLLHLDLSGCCELCSLPESFSDLQNLTHLDLAHCSALYSLPKSFGRLSELHYLNLSCCFKLNLLVGMENICCVTSLQYLNLSRCPSLIYLPESVSNLKNLQTLDLSGCQWIENFPQSLCEITSLKFLLIQGCSPWLQKRVRESQFKNDILTLPKFIVQRAMFGKCSNISRLQSVYPAELEIECLENVTCIEEIGAVNLAAKSTLYNLTMAWTPAVERFVEDEALLQNLQPPESLVTLKLQSYMATSFSGWMIDLASCLPDLVRIEMVDLPRCEHLPPFGQLQNLEQLILKRMPILRKLGVDICGGNGAFKKLRELTLANLGNLEEWVTKVSAKGEFMFPSLYKLEICHCPKLRLKPCLPRANEWRIEASDEVVASQYDAASSSSLMLSKLHVRSCRLLPSKWALLQFIPTLEVLEISNYHGPTLPEGIRFLVSLRSLQIDGCHSVELSEELRILSSLQELIISGCTRLRTLPEYVLTFTALKKLEINDNDALQRWFRGHYNWIRHSDIKDKIYFDGKLMKHSPEDDRKANIWEGSNSPADTKEWGQDEDLEYFTMYGYGESSRAGR